MQNVESRLNICFDTILNIPKFEEYIKPNFCSRKVSFDDNSKRYEIFLINKRKLN